MRGIRIIVDIILLLCAFILPWWFTAAFAIGAAVYFAPFYEIVVLGVIVDSLYNASVSYLFHIQFILTYGALVIVYISTILKERLRFYR